MSEEIEQELPEEEAAVEVEPEVEQDEDAVALEEEARKYGWRPKEEFDLEPEGWVDAEKFLSFPKTQVKMQRDLVRELKQQAEERDRKYAEDFERIKATNKVAIDRVRKQEEERYAAQIERIRSEKRQAAEVADTEAYDRLDAEEKNLKRPEPVAAPETPKTDPVLQSYIEKNEWTKDPLLFHEARQAVDFALKSGMPLETTEAQLNYAESAMKRKYPHMFAAPEPKRSKVDPGGLGFGAKRGKGAADLPKDAQAVAREYVEEGIYKSVDEYAKDYWAQEV